MSAIRSFLEYGEQRYMESIRGLTVDLEVAEASKAAKRKTPTTKTASKRKPKITTAHDEAQNALFRELCGGL